MTQDNFNKINVGLKYQLTETEKEFKKYKYDNDLERIFAEGINVIQRKKILDAIKELSIESDWHSINKEVVENQSIQMTSMTLETV